MPVQKPTRPGLPPVPDEGAAPATLSERSAEWLRAHQNPLLVGASLVVLVGSLLWWLHARGESRTNSAWTELAGARTAEDIRKVADAYEDTDAAPFIRLQLAGALQREGKSDEAHTEYQKAADRMPSPVLAEMIKIARKDMEKNRAFRTQEVPKLLQEMKANHDSHGRPGEPGGPAGPQAPPGETGKKPGDAPAGGAAEDPKPVEKKDSTAPDPKPDEKKGAVPPAPK